MEASLAVIKQVNLFLLEQEGVRDDGEQYAYQY